MPELLKQLLYVALYLFGIGIVGFLVGRLIPKRTLDYKKFPYKPYAFEKNGQIYERFNMKKWQDKVPDMSKLFTKLMPKKKIEGMITAETSLRMIRETCMAELIHIILALLGLIIPVIMPNILGWLIAAVYIIAGNVAFIIIQRYNRPRLVKIHEMQLKVKKRKPTDVMIMSANTGGGHNSVARAIKAYYEENGKSVDIVDALSFKSEEYSKMISDVHSFVYNHLPWLFGMGWYIVEHSRHIQFGEYSLNRMGFRAASKELNRCINDNGYNTVICTHVFAALMLGDTVSKYGMKLKTGRVETDYMNSPGAEFGFVDYHFVPSYMMIPQMVSRGAARDSIVVSGIPLNQRNYEVLPRNEAKKAIGIPEDVKHIFIMFGSEGNGPIEDIIERLKTGLEYPAYITAVCGKNEKLAKKLQEKYQSVGNVKIYGYAENVPDIMDSTDIFIGKPGGISITEAAARKLDILVFSTVGGCEKYNKDFFVDHGAAIEVTAASYVAKECNMLISDELLRTEISEAAYALIKTGSPKIIYDTLSQ